MKYIFLIYFLLFNISYCYSFELKTDINESIMIKGFQIYQSIDFNEFIKNKIQIENPENILNYKNNKFNETEVLYETIKNILIKYDIYSDEFLFLLLGTAAVETNNGKYLNNPIARGLFQIEPETAKYTIDIINKLDNDTWKDILNQSMLQDKNLRYQLHTNLELQVVMMFLALQVKGLDMETLTLDRHDLAVIWKKYWNTWKGKGTVNRFKSRWKDVKLNELKKNKIFNK